MKKFFKLGFTLAETIMVFAVLGIISVLTVGSFTRQDSIKGKQISVVSKSFYANIENVYGQILGYNAKNGVITSIDDVNKDNKIDSSDLRDLVNSYMDGTNVDCSSMGFSLESGTTVADYLKESVCARHNGKIVAGYYLNTACNLSVTAKDIFIKGEESLTRTVQNACGYVVYGLKGSKGNLGTDVFVVPLGKIGLK